MKRTVINSLSILSDTHTVTVSKHSVRNYFSLYCKTSPHTSILKTISIFQVESTDLLFRQELHMKYILTLGK